MENTKKKPSRFRNFLKGFTSIFAIFEPAVWNYEEEFGTDEERISRDWKKVVGDIQRVLPEGYSMVEDEQDILKKKELARNWLRGLRKQRKEVDRHIKELSQALEELGGCGHSSTCEYIDDHLGPCSWEDGHAGC